jgi:uncharacterized membrane protein YcaP (DUF421 family)
MAPTHAMPFLHAVWRHRGGSLVHPWPAGVGSMNSLMHLSMPWWHFALRGAAVYLILLCLLRLAGKRSFGEMSAFDVVVLILVGGTMRTSIIGSDTSFLGGIIAVASILAVDRGLAWICTRSAPLNRLVEGWPSILARNGQRSPEALRRCNLPEAAFERALHAAGLENEATVITARLEPNGRITLIREHQS